MFESNSVWRTTEGSSWRAVSWVSRKASRASVAVSRGARVGGGGRNVVMGGISFAAAGPVSFGGSINCFGIGSG